MSVLTQGLGPSMSLLTTVRVERVGDDRRLGRQAGHRSPTVKPSGNGSSASTTYWLMPLIHALPLSVGTTAAYGPTDVSDTRQPVKTVPRIPSWRNGWPRPSLPRACSVAMRAHVPVPHADRSRAPVQVSGRSQSNGPVEITTALRMSASELCAGPLN